MNFDRIDNMNMREEEISEEQRLTEIEKIVRNQRKKDRRENVRKALSFGAAGAGAYGAGKFLGDEARDFAEGIAEAVHGAQTAGELATIQFRDNELSGKYVGMLPEETRSIYFDNLGQEDRLAEVFFAVLESMQRGSLGFPAVESEPIRGLISLRRLIMEKTQDAANLVIGRDKEEAEIRNTEQYTDNYNEIARLGLDAIGQREVIRGEINDLSKKLEATYVNTGEVDSRGMDALGGLAEHYNSLAGLLRDLQNLEVRDIYAGRQDNEFISAVGRAESYGVKPFDAEGWGDTGFYAAIALGAFAAYKVTKPIVSVLMGLYDVGRLSAGASKRAAGVVKTGIKAVKGRIKQVRERRKTKKV